MHINFVPCYAQLWFIFHKLNYFNKAHLILESITARVANAVQHDDLGKGHNSAPHRTVCVVAPVQGHPMAADKQVRVCVRVPQKPHVSLQGPALQLDHVPPVGHVGAAEHPTVLIMFEGVLIG